MITYKNTFYFKIAEKRKMKKTNFYNPLIVLIVFIILFLNIDLIVSQTEASNSGNLSLEEQAIKCLSNSQQIIDELNNSGFNIERANDILTQAKSVYDAQVINKKTKKDDFSLVTGYCTQIIQLKEDAYYAKDESETLKKFYADSITEEMNSSKVDLLMGEMEQEIKSERYEKIESLSKEIYQEIINLQASYSTLETLRRNTRNFIIRLFIENWKFKLGLIIVLMVLYILFKTPIKKRIILSKINSLELKKKTLKDLIKKTQKSYFERGEFSEGTYNIRTKKFAELVRDIDRQIPLLDEELAKIKYEKKLFSDTKNKNKK